MRVRLTQFENSAIAVLVPSDGIVGVSSGTLDLEDWSAGWTLLKLSSPMPYENQDYEELLIRSRWEGRFVGDAEPTSAFVLVPKRRDIEHPASSKDFNHITWAIATTETGA